MTTEPTESHIEQPPNGTLLTTNLPIRGAEMEKTVAKRDARGRFVKKGVLDVVSNVDLGLCSPDLTTPLEETQESDAKPIEQLVPKKKKGAATKSPYFTLAILPSKTNKKTVIPAGAPDLQRLPRAKTPIKRTLSKLSEHLELTDSPVPSQSTPKTRSPGGIISCIPFPPLTSSTFGIIQEKLAHDPFRLLIAVTFLNRTHGKHAIPVFYTLVQKYPTLQSLVDAKKDDIVSVIQHLGLQNQRATTYQTYAQIFLSNPPQKDKRYPVRNYPISDSSSPLKPSLINIKKDEILTDSDPRFEAWEIGHLTQGPYAIDSWRIFCRDKLRGVATSWNGEGSEEGFQPEWMRVLPKDKELRAFLRWMWLKEGFEWDPETGEKEVASAELLKAAGEGRIAWDEKGGMMVCEEEVRIPRTRMQVGNLEDVEVGELGLLL